MSQLPESPSRFGPYTLIYPLGAGGMGQVFLARHAGEHGIQRLLAIKRMLVHLTGRQKLINLFLDEVRIAAQLHHGNIVQVIDHGVIAGQYFMAMEYVHGENLLEVLGRLEDQQQQMPLDLALHLASEVCQGLDYAHRKQTMEGKPLGIVHRDISPQNILISFMGEVKIADFGVARAAEQTHQTLGGELKGKLAFMSPEQAFGKSLDHRSDLFSLGVVLYETLTTVSPFARENPMATLEAVRAAEPPPLSSHRADLPGEIVELVHWTLSPIPDDRPDSARTLYEALQRIMRLHNMVVSAFDLADYMSDLFPESRRRLDDATVQGTTVGRRADESAALERQTLWYLRQRRPEGEAALPSIQDDDGPKTTDEVKLPVHGRLALWLTLGAAVVLGLGLFLASRGPDTSGGQSIDAGRPGLALVQPDTLLPDTSVDVPRTTPPAKATLKVLSVPGGATVTVAGRRLDRTTPLTTRLEPGRYPCTVSLRGYRQWQQVVDLVPHELTVLRPRLEPLAGRLTVRSTHACQIHLDQARVGPAPLHRRPVPPGPVTVTCRNVDTQINATKRVIVAPGGVATVEFAFGVLAINVQPWADVLVDGRSRGTTPLRLILPVGEHLVVLQNAQKGLQRQSTIDINTTRIARISSW